MESKKIVQRTIGALEDDLQHYTMVDKDKVKAKFIEFQLNEQKQILKDLERLEKLEEFVNVYKNTNQRFTILIQGKQCILPNPTFKQEMLVKEILEAQ